MEKQAESAWGLSVQGVTEYGNAGHTKTQRKIGIGTRVRRIPRQPKELAEAKLFQCLMEKEEEKGRRKSKMCKCLKVVYVLFFFSW